MNSMTLVVVTDLHIIIFDHVECKSTATTTNRWCEDATWNSPAISIAILLQGSLGQWIAWSCAGPNYNNLPEIMHASQLRTYTSMSLSISGHHIVSRHLCFIRSRNNVRVTFMCQMRSLLTECWWNHHAFTSNHGGVPSLSTERSLRTD